MLFKGSKNHLTKLIVARVAQNLVFLEKLTSLTLGGSFGIKINTNLHSTQGANLSKKTKF